jgi:succinate-acetate transporter protein
LQEKIKGQSPVPERLPRSAVVYFLSHFWLATVQEVLQADWQDAWHSPQPPLTADSLRLALFIVFTCFMTVSTLSTVFKFAVTV